jgi:hypothetical protein
MGGELSRDLFVKHTHSWLLIDRIVIPERGECNSISGTHRVAIAVRKIGRAQG